jgi:hypothetical protein
MIELLNKQELALIVESAPVTDGHTGLLNALKSRYPEHHFHLVAEREGRTWNPGIVDREGNRITHDIVGWIDQELDAAGGDAQEVWRRHKDSGLVRAEREGSVLYLTSPYGTEPDAFYQISVEVGPEVTTRDMFDPSPSFPPEDRGDLISGYGVYYGDFKRQTLSPTCYNLDTLVNIRRFLRDLVEAEKIARLAELPEVEKKVVHVHEITLGPEGGQVSMDVPFLDMCPDWLTRTPNAYRLFQDWGESSAAISGELFCRHWWLQLNEWVEKTGEKRFYLCPQWADADGGCDLPVIEPDWEDSPYGVMESLKQFDQKAGYSFSWFFYMLHGNRIMHSAGGVVARAIREGLIKPLPECDERVLMRWREDSYGF